MSSKQITIIPFSGEKNKWNTWKMRYKARVKVLGLADILDGSTKVPTDKKSGYTDDELIIRQRNDELFADIVLSLNDEVSLGCVTRSMCSDWSEGNDHREWENLKEKYEGCKDSNKLDLQRELLTSKLEIEMDPDVWMTKLENIRCDLESIHVVVSNETEFLNQIVTHLPKE